jgi:hypothetical protein
MSMGTKVARVVAVVVLVGCFSTEPTTVALGEEFELAPNQTVQIAGTDLTIGFRRMVGDNRCPLDVLCVVEGSAGAELEVFGSNAENPVVLDTRSGFDSWTDGAYRLRLLEVRPAPLAQRPIKPEDYRLRLVVNPVLPAQ